MYGIKPILFRKCLIEMTKEVLILTATFIYMDSGKCKIIYQYSMSKTLNKIIKHYLAASLS